MHFEKKPSANQRAESAGEDSEKRLVHQFFQLSDGCLIRNGQLLFAVIHDGNSRNQCFDHWID